MHLYYHGFIMPTCDSLFFCSLCLSLVSLQHSIDAANSGVSPIGETSYNYSHWDLGSAFFFAGTVITTIGNPTCEVYKPHSQPKHRLTYCSDIDASKSNRSHFECCHKLQGSISRRLIIVDMASMRFMSENQFSRA